MKAIRFGLLLFLSLLLSTLPVSAAGQGDTNGDGIVSIRDVNLLLQFLPSGGEVPDEEAYDVNGDGIISIKDVTCTLQIIAGYPVIKEPRVSWKTEAGGIGFTLANLPSSVRSAGVLILTRGADADAISEHPETVKAIGQAEICEGKGSIFLPLDDPDAPCTAVISYAGKTLLREVN